MNLIELKATEIEDVLMTNSPVDVLLSDETVFVTESDCDWIVVD